MRGFTFVKMPGKFQLDEKGAEDLKKFAIKDFRVVSKIKPTIRFNCQNKFSIIY